MKKTYLAIAACVLVSVASCNADKDSKTASQQDKEEQSSTQVQEIDENLPAEEKVTLEEMAQNNEKEGTVVKTESGLVMKVYDAGTGTHATDNSDVTLHYRGSLENGYVFDSSYNRGEPATFKPSQVIPGFGEGIKALGKGGKATLYIPADIAYGQRAIPQAGIPANSNLIFDIEILDIK